LGRKPLGNWHDRVCGLLLLLSVVLLFIPSSIRFRLTIPLQTVLLAPLRGTAWVRATLINLGSENRRLSRLATELALENAHLRSVCRAAQELPAGTVRLVLAPVISRDLATFERFFIVSRGSDQGISPGCPVLAPAGIAGRVIATSTHQSLVQTILDPDCRIAVINLRSRSPAMARPESKSVGPLAHQHQLLTLDYVSQDADFQVGDTIVSAGLGGVFPRGLRLGVVTGTSDQPSALFRPVQVKPFVDVTKLEQVFIVCIPESLPHTLRDGWLDNLIPLELTVPGEAGR